MRIVPIVCMVPRSCVISSRPHVQMDVDEDLPPSQWSHDGAIMPFEGPYGEQDEHDQDHYDSQSSGSATKEWFAQQLAADSKAKATAASKRQRLVEMLAAQLPPCQLDMRAAELAVVDVAQMMPSRVCHVSLRHRVHRVSCLLLDSCALAGNFAQALVDIAVESAIELRFGANGDDVWRDASFPRPIDAADMHAESWRRFHAFEAERSSALADGKMVCATCMCMGVYFRGRTRSLCARVCVCLTGRARLLSAARFGQRCGGACGH